MPITDMVNGSMFWSQDAVAVQVCIDRLVRFDVLRLVCRLVGIHILKAIVDGSRGSMESLVLVIWKQII